MKVMMIADAETLRPSMGSIRALGNRVEFCEGISEVFENEILVSVNFPLNACAFANPFPRRLLKSLTGRMFYKDFTQPNLITSCGGPDLGRTPKLVYDRS